MSRLPLVPPLIELGRRLGWEPLPLTIKEGRAFARRLADRLEGLSSAYSLPSAVSSSIVFIRDLHFAYTGRPALRGINLEVRPGEFVVLMGRNGSGKSTLLKQIVGLLKPGEGKVTVVGLDTARAPREEVIRHVGYVPQHPGALLFSETLAAELAFTRKSHGMPADPAADQALLDRLGLGALTGRDPRDLSGGEQQRAALAAILVAGPQIILLDEPTRGLDYAQKRSLADLLLGLKREGRTVIMATHDVELAAACADRVVLLGEGQVVVDGPARQVMSDSQVFSSQINKLFRDPRYLVVEDVLCELARDKGQGANGK
jgi:energy-coupling factor transport system ATP-binding protein